MYTIKLYRLQVYAHKAIHEFCMKQNTSDKCFTNENDRKQECNVKLVKTMLPCRIKYLYDKCA